MSEDETTVRPLRLIGSGDPVADLLPLIESWAETADRLEPVGEPIPLAEVEVRAPLRPVRNVFCVGRNYREHAAEFSRSGFDASDPPASATDPVPEHPVVFTKTPESVIASGAAIEPHLAATRALDYEGELAVIVGREGRDIAAGDAWRHVWGYTLFNDVTARDRQRDHTQWFLGKALDSFGPMGPYAVTADEIDLPSLRLTTYVNGEKRQDALLADLIFDVPTLIATISRGLTLRPGDVIATGTPAGVGIGFDPPRYLRPGDVVTISAPRLGRLGNPVGPAAPVSSEIARPRPATREARRALRRQRAAARTLGSGMRRIGDRDLFVEVSGQGPPVVFVHGLGGSTNVFQPQVPTLERSHTLIRFDLSGHGRSPLAGRPSIESWADDLEGLLDELGYLAASVVAHSMGTLVAGHFAATRPHRVDKLVLLGAVREQPERAAAATRERAATVRQGGMAAVADTILDAALAENTRWHSPLAVTAARELLLGQRPEGYARACEALAAARDPGWHEITAPVLLLTGGRDKVGPVATSEYIAGRLDDAESAQVMVIEGIGHWHTLEAPTPVTDVVCEFLTKP